MIKYSGALDMAQLCSHHVFAYASNTAFRDDTATRKSTKGYLFQLFRGLIDWYSTKQKIVTMSSTEAELLALSHAAKESLWWIHLFQSI